MSDRRPASEDYNILTIRHDPDNPKMVALVDRIYALIFPHSRAVNTNWHEGVEEHRFLIID